MFSNIEFIKVHEGTNRQSRLVLEGSPHVLAGLLARALNVWVNDLVLLHKDVTGVWPSSSFHKEQLRALIAELAERAGV